jgi:diguanylate cyclase (GGDEF)-like protein
MSKGDDRACDVAPDMIEIPDSLQKRLSSCQSLPSAPAVAIKIINLCRQDDTGIPEIATVLARDPALAAKVLKTANSALYGVRFPVTTLERAISMMGINATLSLSLSFSLVGNLRKAGHTGFDHLKYWRRSVITAATAKTVCALRGAGGSDECFLAGLLLDIGMLALNEAQPEAYGRLVSRAKGSHQNLVALERETFGADHGAIGGWLLQRWKLPDSLSLALTASHNPGSANAPDLTDFCRAVAFAGHFAGMWDHPQIAEGTREVSRMAQEDLGMTPGQFEQLLNEVAKSLPEVTSNLEVEIGSEETLDNLFNQAREALVLLNLQALEQVRTAQNLANYDGLTSLHNRRYLEEVLEPLFDAAARLRRPLSVIFIDVDHFKKTNDTHGHQAGDQVLVSLAAILRSAVRTSDIAVRYGGEEFLCLLPNTGEPLVRVVAERIRAAIASAPFKIGANAEIHITASLGYTTFSSGRTFASAQDLLQEADRCLYAAKQAGRNRVMSPGAESGGTSHPMQ